VAPARSPTTATSRMTSSDNLFSTAGMAMDETTNAREGSVGGVARVAGYIFARNEPNRSIRLVRRRGTAVGRLDFNLMEAELVVFIEAKKKKEVVALVAWT
jgi:hypothetical protein